MPAEELTIPYMPVAFPWCCRYKERGVMYCHHGHDCKCECHGTLAPPAQLCGTRPRKTGV